MAAVLRTGRAGSSTTADHIAVTDLALAQIPDAHRHGTPILISADGAGATKNWLAHLRAQRESGVDLRFLVGCTATNAVQEAIGALPEQAWTPAIKANGQLRDGADVAEITGLLPHLTAAGWPAGMGVILRQAPPQPGAQLRFTDTGGWPIELAAPNLCHQHPRRQLTHLKARHRSHARVQDRIRCAKQTGLDHPPSREFAINQAWLELALTACDLIPWTQTTLLHDSELVRAEPRLLRNSCCTLVCGLSHRTDRGGFHDDDHDGSGPHSPPARGCR